MSAFIDLSGTRFGRLFVVERAPRQYLRAFWKCKCDCGRTATVNGSKLRNGHTKSCGCLSVDTSRTLNTTHGGVRKPEYAIWCAMKTRCTNKNDRYFPDYGGRGIVVCDRWIYDFAAFYADMGPRPTARHSIDRIDNDGPYAPDNCRWATQREQSSNTRVNVMLTVGGVTKTLTQWAFTTGVRRETITARLGRGWPADRAVSAAPLTRWERRRNDRNY